jgi:hypothetical protein
MSPLAGGNLTLADNRGHLLLELLDDGQAFHFADPTLAG